MNTSAELPVVDPKSCTGCGDCAAICPTECLAMEHGLPWVPRPRDCVACAACGLICPANAIRFEACE